MPIDAQASAQIEDQTRSILLTREESATGNAQHLSDDDALTALLRHVIESLLIGHYKEAFGSVSVMSRMMLGCRWY